MSDCEPSPASTRRFIENSRVGHSILGNKRAFERLPQDVRDVVTREFDRSAADQRADVAKLSESLRQELTEKGLQFIEVDRKPFRQALAKTTSYKEGRASSARSLGSPRKDLGQAGVTAMMHVTNLDAGAADKLPPGSRHPPALSSQPGTSTSSRGTGTRAIRIEGHR